MLKQFLGVLCVMSLSLGCVAQECPWAPEDAQAKAVELKDTGKTVTVNIDGKLFTEYHYTDVIRPYFYPVIGPSGGPVNRHFPMKKGVTGEAADHPHHKSLWYTHGNVGGVDFWDDRREGRIVQKGAPELVTVDKAAAIVTENNWITTDGKLICTDKRVYRFISTPDGPMIDFEITYQALKEKDLVLGDTKEGSMAIRLAPTMRLKGEVGQGHIVNSEGVRDGATWGKRAKWCDYYGPVNDQIVGVAIFDHPENPRFPTWWHVRDYGLFAANPFGIHDFEKKEAGVGDLTVSAGETTTFRYRFYFHEGDEKEGKVSERYAEWAAKK